MLRRFKRWLFGLCPQCGGELDRDTHGYEQKWAHCYECGWCSMAVHFGRKHCGVREATEANYKNYWRPDSD